jgi:mannose-1-phosphate guanylyltransferase/mannose-6-phosphate isomerase
MLLPVILAGGVGSRLWPLSRDLYPKQLLSLIGEQSLLQATVARALQIPTVHHLIVVCSQQYQFLVKEQMEALQETYSLTFDLILEPTGRNTAPALALAAFRAVELHHALLLALPADHLIGNSSAFAHQLQEIIPHIDNKLVTFGVKPDYPETGYGYIEVDDAKSHEKILAIKRFVEKPDRATAEAYCQQKTYYWNSGIFLYQPSSYLAELKTYAPDVLSVCEQAWTQKTHQSESIYLDPAIPSTMRLWKKRILL